MQNSGKWFKSPIVALPISAAALGLAVVPFLVWGTDHAAQFYGSFTAALVAAGAVIGTAYLQANFIRRRDDVLRQQEVYASALELYVWMGTLASAFEFCHSVLDALLKDDPSLTLSAKAMRSNLKADIPDALRARIPVAARLPSKIGRPLLGTLYASAEGLDYCAYLPIFPPEVLFDASQIKDRSDHAKSAAKQVRYQRARLAEFLVNEHVLDELDQSDSAVIAAGP